MDALRKLQNFGPLNITISISAEIQKVNGKQIFEKNLTNNSLADVHWS